MVSTPPALLAPLRVQLKRKEGRPTPDRCDAMKRGHSSLGGAGSSTESPITIKKEKTSSVKVSPLCLSGPDFKNNSAAGVRLEVEMGDDGSAVGYLLKTNGVTTRLMPNDDNALNLFVAACISKTNPDSKWNKFSSDETVDPSQFFLRILSTAPPGTLVAKLPFDLLLNAQGVGTQTAPVLGHVKHHGEFLRSALSTIKSGSTAEPATA